jgi:Protein of unknown function (DUF1501)
MNPSPDFSAVPGKNPGFLGRRQFIYHLGSGLGALALSSLLSQERAGAAETGSSSAVNPLLPKRPHFPARAKSVIFLMMEGGASHIDTFDPKPKLAQLEGKLFERHEKVKSNQSKGERYFTPSPFAFRRYGQCGMEVSELFQNLGGCVDDLAFVRSVYGDSDNHPAAMFQFLTGQAFQGSPSVGSWIVYGLGTENQNLPAFVVLRDGRPYGGTATWSNAYLPACYQGTQLRSGANPVLDLQPPPGVSPNQERENLDLLQIFNREFSRRHPAHPDLAARIANYELAFRMQVEVPETLDIDAEPEAIRKLYGLDQDATKGFGTSCLRARRLVERGVRFVQVWAGGWDSHEDILHGHRNAASRVDRPLAGLIQDLKQRGLLDETLVVWGGEFGRTPDTNASNYKNKKPGRDHNPAAMTMWFAGGGTRGGALVGATDELGHKAADHAYHLRDVHATLLQLCGLDQSKLTFYHAGRFKQLTDTGGTVIRGILA